MKAKINFGKAGQEFFSLISTPEGWCWINDKRTSQLSLGGYGSTKQNRNEAIVALSVMYKGRHEIINECVVCDKTSAGDCCSYECAGIFCAV